MAEVMRREFMKVLGASAAGMAWTAPVRGRLPGESGKIRIGQIGTKHGHAAGKMGALRTLNDRYEVVGIVEPDANRRRAVEKSRAYRGLTWMSEEDLLGVKGLQAVAVETDVPDLIPTARRCVDAGFHVHLDKPPGDSLKPFQKLLDTAASKKGRNFV